MTVNITSTSGLRMFSNLPDYYEKSDIMRNLMQSRGVELDNLKDALDETMDQFFPQTATWSLSDWEAGIGLPTDLSKPDSQRRSTIVSKLRGMGTITMALVEGVAEAYDNGSISVTQQPSLYQITVQFVDTLGLPPNLADLQEAVRNVVPAHLQIVYQYKYLYVNQIHGVMTISQIQAHPLSDFSPFVN